MPNFKENTDEALMGFLQKGSSTALEEIYLRYSKDLLSLMYRMLQCNEALAQDLLHDVFLKIIEKPKQFDTSRKFKPWIYAIATNACRKSYRSKTTVDINSLENKLLLENSTEQKIDEKQFNLSLDQYLKELSYEHREVFILKHQQDLSIKEIAAILHCAEGTIKSRLNTTRNILAKKLKPYHHTSTL